MEAKVSFSPSDRGCGWHCSWTWGGEQGLTIKFARGPERCHGSLAPLGHFQGPLKETVFPQGKGGDAVLWLVISEGLWVLGRDSSSCGTSQRGPRGEAVALHISNRILCFLSMVAGGGGGERAPLGLERLLDPGCGAKLHPGPCGPPEPMQVCVCTSPVARLSSWLSGGVKQRVGGS